MWGFERGRIYNRQRDIHARFKGQEQSGIVTPSKFKVIILITGDAGLNHGYSDQPNPDGTFDYFGQGQIGDMEFVRGNKAIAEHQKNGRDLLLFQKTVGGLRFEGPVVYEGHRFQQATDTKGEMRQAIVFKLRRIDVD